MKYGISFDSPLGPLLIVEEEGAIVELRFVESAPDIILNQTPLLLLAKQQILQYFRKERTDFTLPLFVATSSFYGKVYQAMQKIPYGTVASYHQLAASSGNEAASRAVGNACHRNPLPILIPCHRVVASHHLGGYALGLDVKRKLLSLEGTNLPFLIKD